MWYVFKAWKIYENFLRLQNLPVYNFSGNHQFLNKLVGEGKHRFFKLFIGSHKREICVKRGKKLHTKTSQKTAKNMYVELLFKHYNYILAYSDSRV